MTLSSYVHFAAILTLSVLRVVQQLLFIDPTTGFYQGGGWIQAAQDVVYITVTMTLLLFSSRSPRLLLITTNRQKKMSICALVFGCVVALSAGLALISALRAGPLDRRGFGMVLGIFSGLAIMLMAQMMMKKGVYRGPLLIAAIPAIWLAYTAMTKFMGYDTIVTISDRVLELISLCLGAMFFLSHARMVGSIEIDRRSALTRLFGYLFPLYAVTFTFGQMVAFVFGRYTAVMLAPWEMISMFSLGLYSWMFCDAIKEY